MTYDFLFCFVFLMSIARGRRFSKGKQLKILNIICPNVFTEALYDIFATESHTYGCPASLSTTRVYYNFDL